MTEPTPSLFVSVPEAARLLAISKAHLYRMMSRGDVPYQQFGTRRVIPRQWLDAQVDAAMQPAAVIDLAAIARRKRRNRR